MGGLILHNCLIAGGDSVFRGILAIEGDRFAGVWKEDDPEAKAYIEGHRDATLTDLGSKVVMAGGIDAHVHFREPGMEWKGDIGTESRAAISGGVTSFIDMPNTNPPTVSEEALRGKAERAMLSSAANYGFHIGASYGNLEEIKEMISRAEASGRHPFAGIKVFMGSSTGNMLVDRQDVLESIFSIKERVILVHSEDEGTIRANLEAAKERFNENIPFSSHPAIRSREACVKSTERAIGLALKHGTRLHILHVSTKEEVDLIRDAKRLSPHITAETSPNYLWFCDEDYGKMGGRLKCNPAVKTASDRQALRQAVREGVIDTIGTDHAPHLPGEKNAPYLSCPSGLPSISECLSVLTTVFDKEEDLSLIARIFSENVARIFRIKDRGVIKAGNYADLTVLDPAEKFTVRNTDVTYKCGWSPYEGVTLKGRVKMTFLGGRLAARDGRPISGPAPLPLEFSRF